MYKALTLLLALVGLAQSNAATSIVEVDFTKVSALPSNWTAGSWNNSSAPYYNFSPEKGASVRGSWGQNYLSTSLSAPLSSENSYSISFSTFASNSDNQTCFYLASGDYSILIGNSYTRGRVEVGDVNQDLNTKYASFHNSIVTAKTGGDPQGTMVNVGKSLDYTITLSSGSLILSVTDGTNTYSNSYAIADDFSFSSIGFSNDGGSGVTGIKNLKVVQQQQIPEPASASLGLLGVAALMLRRRRA